MLIRKFVKGEEKELLDLFYSSIHINAKNYYSIKQLNAWTNNEIDFYLWCKKINKINPYVLLDSNLIVGYADLQDSGYIDHFFIRGGFSNKGFGSILMEYILKKAKAKNIPYLEANVSLAAQSFFKKFGFMIIKKKKVIIREIELENALMRVYLDK
ncbi:MAG: GNAT family N-acetyltransferase [Pleomorphochaeta sp.]